MAANKRASDARAMQELMRWRGTCWRQSQTHGQLFASQRNTRVIISDGLVMFQFPRNDPRFSLLVSELGYLKALPGIGYIKHGETEEGAVYRTDRKQEPQKVLKPALWEDWEERERMDGPSVGVSGACWLDYAPPQAPHLDALLCRLDGADTSVYVNQRLLRFIEQDIRALQRNYRLVLITPELVRVQRHLAEPVKTGELPAWDLSPERPPKAVAVPVLEIAHEWETVAYLATTPPTKQMQEEDRRVRNSLPPGVTVEAVRDLIKEMQDGLNQGSRMHEAAHRMLWLLTRSGQETEQAETPQKPHPNAGEAAHVTRDPVITPIVSRGISTEAMEQEPASPDPKVSGRISPEVMQRWQEGE